METLTLGWSGSKEGNRNSCSHESGGGGEVDAGGVAGEERHVVTRREPGSEGEPGHFDVDVKIGIQPTEEKEVNPENVHACGSPDLRNSASCSPRGWRESTSDTIKVYEAEKERIIFQHRFTLQV